MCGIAGIVNLEPHRPIKAALLAAMIGQLGHRGPDDSNLLCLEQAGLAHARLSIIDLELGRQPIGNEDQSVQVVFNGEIFNYLELRAELTRQGHRFATRSDTEVIVHLYEELGEDFVHQLNGQFAIALYDRKRQKLLLARDRIGIAPLFYGLVDGQLLFASEIKAILTALPRPPRANPDALAQIFTFWSPVSPNTLFRDIFEVSPGQLVTVEQGRVHRRIYWDWQFPERGRHPRQTEDEAAARLKDLLIDATRIRLRSDVPVGAYLSGGLDSSSIVALINNYSDNPLRTFSIGFEDAGFDERPFQQRLIDQLQTRHSEILCGNPDISEHFMSAIWHTELPILRTAPVPMKILSSLVRANGYKVVLTGEGADEVLGGYDLFKETKIRHYWSRSPDSRWRPTLLRRLYPYLDMAQGDAYLKAFFGQGIEQPDRFSFSHLTRWSSTARCREFFSDDLRQTLASDPLQSMRDTLPADFAHWDYFNRAQYIEAKSLMGGYLLCSQGDRMLMSNSIEGRFPFLDHRVIEFCNQLPPRFKMRALNEKFLLKKAMRDELDAGIVARHKQPYRAPDIPAFFGERVADYVTELLSAEKIGQYGYFDPRKVDRLLRKIGKGRAIGNTDNMALVGILSTQVWHFHFIERFHDHFQADRAR